MNVSRSAVDKALDKYVAQMGRRGVEPDGVRVSTLATLAGVSTRKMSGYLQVYRKRQAKGTTRYTLGCEGYGNPETSANPPRWRILAKPGSDPKVVQQARNDHAIYLAGDSLKRTVNDYVSEVYPALRGTDRDRVIEVATRGLLQHVKVDVDQAVELLR